jgi:valyl-tRNA synthetase
MLSTQWFADVRKPAAEALKAVEDGRIELIPERFTKIWEHWLTNIQPWCISRQLWWGHRIPAWHCLECQHITVARIDPTECEACHATNIEQDPDVLDTWFSSGLWPFSTLGWPEETADLKRFYPTTMMETGYDILFFWVARMVMMGLSFTDQAPFKHVFLHGLVRDAEGKKMSKSYGNVIDPLEMMDKFGTDALRFTLLTGSTPGNDMNLSEDRIESNRNFANKIWNAARFLTSNLEGENPTGKVKRTGLSLPDRWILSRLHRLIDTVNRLMESYLYGEAGRHIYDFLWGEYADWYIEISKIALYGDDDAGKTRTRHILTYVLDQCLRMLHPFVPYVTEEIWQHLPHEGEALIIAPWPEYDSNFIDQDAEAKMSLLMDLIGGVRNIRAEYSVPPSRKVTALINGGDLSEMLRNHHEMLSRLANVDPGTLQIEDQIAQPPDQAASVTLGMVTVYLPLAGLVDLEAEKKRLTKEIEATSAQISRSEGLLNSDFVDRAPPEVVQRERTKMETLQATLASLTDQRSRLK